MGTAFDKDIKLNITEDFLMNEREFWDKYVPQKDKNTIIAGIGIAYLLAAFTLIGVFLGNTFAIVDVIILVVCGVFLQILKSRAAAIVLAVYYTLDRILYYFVLDGHVRSRGLIFTFAVIVALVTCISSTFKYHRMKKDYLNGENTDFFSGKINPVFNPYQESEQVPFSLLDASGGRSTFPNSTPPTAAGMPDSAPTMQSRSSGSYGMEEQPQYSMPTSNYSYGAPSQSSQFGSAKPDLTAPVQETKEVDSWEMEDIKFDR